jgi:hypothetical protein
VVSEAAYQVIMDPSQPHADRVAAFKDRTAWITQTLDGTNRLVQIREMLDRYAEMGLVLRRDGVKGDPEIPPHIYVSDGHKPTTPAAAATVVAAGAPQRWRAATGFVERLGHFPFKPAE